MAILNRTTGQGPSWLRSGKLVLTFAQGQQPGNQATAKQGKETKVVKPARKKKD